MLRAPAADVPVLPFGLADAKLEAPVARRGITSRPALVNRLRAAGSATVATIVAPGAYGKTTLLSQWAERDARPFAWLSLEERDDDPVLLVAYLATACLRIAPVDPTVFAALGKSRPSIWSVAVPRLASALMHAPEPFALVLDDVDRLRSAGSLEILTALIDAVPKRSVIALAGRTAPALPLARLRSEGRLFELDTTALALSPREAGLLFRGAGVELEEEDVETLTQSTEGWAGGLYLAALSFDAGEEAPTPALDGTERFVTDYFQSEYLAKLPRAELQFLRRTSVLDSMRTELCDAVLERSDSARMLERIERSNVFLVPLDRQRVWFRMHHLFRDVLRCELDRAEPGLAPELAGRASTWCESNGEPEAAIAYADAAADLPRVAELLAAYAPAPGAGDTATFDGWFRRFDDETARAAHPAVAVLGAWAHARSGLTVEAGRWAESAAGCSRKAAFPDGTPLQACLALLRAAMGLDPIETSQANAERALRQLPPDSPWRGVGLFQVAVGHLLAGDEKAADGAFAEAIDVPEAPAHHTALAERSLLASARGDHVEAEALVLEALALIAEQKLGDDADSALVYAVSARAALRHGAWTRARADLERAESFRPQLTAAIPWYAIQTRIELTRAYLALADVPAARLLLFEIAEIIRRRPHVGMLAAVARELEQELATVSVSNGQEASGLTAAELRLLPLLSTHLSFREIGERLYVSRNTVKTQAISVYRKLGVSSRTAAIDRAGDLGLIDAVAVPVFQLVPTGPDAVAPASSA